MSVKLTGEAEIERIKNRTLPTWELKRSTSIVVALRFARDNGWKENKVQVRVERKGIDIVEYVVEPYESECGCSGILKYGDYFN